MKRVCSSCKEEKSLDCFYKRSDSESGYRSQCKDCHKAGFWRTRDKVKHRKVSYKSQLLKRYNIGVEVFNEMFRLQDGKCLICASDLENIFLDKSGSPVAVDHNHTTGQIRGLLCKNCNSGIGYLKDSRSLLEKAIRYLEVTDENSL